MNFLEQAKKGQGNAGTYVLTLAIVILAYIIGQFFVEILANKFLGYSLINIPDTADLNLLLSLLLLPFGFLLIALAMCVKHLHKRSVLSLFTSRESFDWRRFFVAFGIWGAFLLLSMILGIMTGYQVEWNFNPATFFSLVLVSVLLLPIQTSAEEVLFRGYLFQGFGALFKKGWIAIVLTGVLFGLVHWANPEIAKIGDILLVFYIGTGLFLGILVHMDDGLELSMGYHTVNNIFASLIITNEWQAFHTDALFIDKSPPTFGWEVILTLIVLQPLLLFIFSRIYKWKNWKEKLLK